MSLARLTLVTVAAFVAVTITARSDDPTAIAPEYPNDLTAKIVTLAPGFNRALVYPEYRDPQPDTLPVPEEIVAGVNAAYAIAPEYLRKRLREITYIFVDYSNEAPFGFRTHPRRYAPDDKRSEYLQYIGIPARLPPAYETLETYAIHHLLGWDGDTRPIKVHTDPSSSTYSYLAVLAHEVAHIEFQRLYWPAPGDNYDPKLLCNSAFHNETWVQPTDLQMATAFNAVRSRHQSGVQIEGLLATLREAAAATKLAASSDQFDKARAMLGSLYRTGQWFTLLSSFTPEHDFVEVFKSVALLNSKLPLQMMVIDVGDQQIDILEQLLHQDSPLARKFECMERWALGEKLR